MRVISQAFAGVHRPAEDTGADNVFTEGLRKN